eukprot:795939-Karenia_brevis.AAC.1
MSDFNGKELIESAEKSEVGQMRSMIGYQDGRVIHGHKYRREFVHHASEQCRMRMANATATVIAALADANS